MTGAQLKRARERLKLTQEQLATLLGYGGKLRRNMVGDLEAERRKIRAPQKLLVEAYLAGYRPKNWPAE